jgi:hypothetical protein
MVRDARFTAFAVFAAVLALATPAQVRAESTTVSLPGSTAVWDGAQIRVDVQCALPMGACTGNMSGTAPGDSQPFAGSDYNVPANTTATVGLDPGGASDERINALSSIVVRLTPSAGQGDPVEREMRLVKTHRRRVTLTIGRSATGRLVARGGVDALDNFAACAQHVTVKIERRSGTDWVTVATTATGDRSDERGMLFVRSFPGRPGVYRARVPQQIVGEATCLEASSGTRSVELARHRRKVGLIGVPSGPGGIYAVGEVDPLDRFSGCTRHPVIQIQRRSGSRWATVRRARAGGGPHGVRPNGGAVFNILIPARAGHYRVVAPQFSIGRTDVCLRAVSRVVSTR